MNPVRHDTPCSEADHAAARVPRVLWIELTSKCPFDCVFCARRGRRGPGEHMDFAMLERLMAELETPECIRLNYSGESLHYPWLTDAIRLAKETGASVELVTALASADDEVLRAVVCSGLDRLGVSLHTTAAAQWTAIYGKGSLERLSSRLDLLLALREEYRVESPALEIAFVAMRSNLQELPAVVSLARRKRIPLVTVLPVIRRGPARETFPDELDERGRLRESFRNDLNDVLQKARGAFAGVEVRGGPEIDGPGVLANGPGYHPDELPPGTRIRTCDQDPWESTHILANGDVVPCEVQDTLVLGNLRARSLRSIWHGAEYREFRRGFASGRNPACLSCAWKMACASSPPKVSLVPSDGENAQLIRGWHPRDRAGTLWSKREAAMALLRNTGTEAYFPEGSSSSFGQRGA